MKMTKEDYQNLRDAIINVPLVGILLSRSSMSHRWGLFYQVSSSFRHLYEYLNDDHIDTALRKIVREIG